MMKKTLILTLFTLTIVPILSGCGGATDRGTGTRGIDPNAGNWATIQVSNSGITSTPPPVAGSVADLADISTLRSLDATRTSGEIATAQFWNEGAVLQWNRYARDLVKARSPAPTSASRIYALLSLAQYDALVAVWKEKYKYNTLAPSPTISGLRPLFAPPPGPCYPSEHAAVAAASARVLKAAFALDTAEIDAKMEEHILSRQIACVSRPSDCDYGQQIGDAVAGQILTNAVNDGSASADNPITIPTGPGYWFPATGTTGQTPQWGNVRPLKIGSINSFIAPPPVVFGSAKYLAELAEIRTMSDNRTSEQLAIAEYWAGGGGTVTPPGIWNERADALIASAGYSEVRAARAMVYLNVAMFDAGITIWKTKYTYFTIRPSQQDPGITTPVGLPNHPSYGSGHSGYSAAGARVLSYIFPWESAKFTAEAEEAGLSRFYGGIHYRSDHEASKEVGRRIGDAVLRFAKDDGAGSGL